MHKQKMKLQKIVLASGFLAFTLISSSHLVADDHAGKSFSDQQSISRGDLGEGLRGRNVDNQIYLDAAALDADSGYYNAEGGPYVNPNAYPDSSAGGWSQPGDSSSDNNWSPPGDDD